MAGTPEPGSPERRSLESRHDRERFGDERARWLALVHDVTRAINEAADWEEALRQVLQILCSSLGWQLGYVYLPDRDAPEFLVPATSYVADERVRPFHDAFEHARYRRGQSLPGRALTGEPIWMDDRDTLLQSLPMRAQAAGDAGLRAAAVLPITVGTRRSP